MKRKRNKITRRKLRTRAVKILSWMEGSPVTMGDLLDLAAADDWAKTRREVDRSGAIRNTLSTLIKNKQVSKHGKIFKITREGGIALRQTLKANGVTVAKPRKRAARKVTRKVTRKPTPAKGKFVMVICDDVAQLAQAFQLVAKGGTR